MSDGTTASSAPARRPVAAAAPDGTAADLLRVPAAAADQAGAVPRSSPADAETSAQLALMQERRPG